VDSKVCTAQVYSPVMFQSGFFIDITPGLPSIVNILLSIFDFMKPYIIARKEVRQRQDGVRLIVINFGERR